MPSLRGAPLEEYEAVVLEYLQLKHVAYHALDMEWRMDAAGIVHSTIAFHTTDRMGPTQIHRLQHAIEEAFTRDHHTIVRVHCAIQVESPAETTLCCM